MSDMFGTLRSNTFEVVDVDAFKKWFEENVTFCFDVDIWVEGNFVAFGGRGQYPSAHPCKNDGICEKWDLDEFAAEVRKHLKEDQEFRVLAAGNEKLRYVSANHLIITHTTHEINNYREGN